MKILLVEDDRLKGEQLRALLAQNGYDVVLSVASYRSALGAVMRGGYDVCVLDLSLPTFDRQEGGDDSDLEPLGGRLLLEEMKRKGRAVPTVVVTQYRLFGELMVQETLEEVDDSLKEEFPEFYLGAVFYSDENTDWQKALLQVLAGVRLG